MTTLERKEYPEPIHIISLGAGVQSSTMALMAACGEITPMPKCAVFADTQAEPKSVYTWLDWLEKQLPFPVHRITQGSLTDDSLKVRNRKSDGKRYVKINIPAFTFQKGGRIGLNQRQCTRDFKIHPIHRAIKGVLGKTGADRCVQWIGISSDEIYRMKPSGKTFIENRWPLIEKNIHRRHCLEWMTSHSFPQPPRSACVYCPYHSDIEWRRLKEEEPESFSKAIHFERRMHSSLKEDELWNGTIFLHKSMKPLSEVDFSTEEERGQLNMFNNECEGMCGV